MDEMEEVGYSAEQFKQEVSTTGWCFRNCAGRPEETVAAIDKFYETYDIRIFAPSHTNVIRKDLPRYLDSLREAMRMAITGDFHLVY